MSSIPVHTPESAPASSQPALQRLLKGGRIPNMLGAMANSPATLNGYLQLAQSLSQGSFSAAERERIALAVSAENGCEYCLAAHGWKAEQAGLSPAQQAAARAAGAKDPLAALAVEVLRSRGRLDAARLRAAGLDDGKQVELVAQVALLLLSNYLNNLVQPQIDFPPPA
jgi:uncharacterized peroxidase-related enzyme